MYVGEAIRTSFEEVRAHKLRSGLTLSGVILGTIALVVVLSVLDGITAAVWQGFEDLGFDGVLIVNAKNPADAVERAKAHLSKGLRPEDQQVIQEGDLIQAVAPVGETRAVITAQDAVRRVTVYGITPEFAIAKNRKTSAGRFISSQDVRDMKAVCVLGEKLKNQLFGNEDAIGKTVTIGGRRLSVVGIGTKFNMNFVQEDGMRKETGGLYVPLPVYETMFGRKNAVSYYIIKATNPDEVIDAEGETRSLFARAHSGIHDVGIDNIGKEMLKERKSVEVLLRNWLIVFVAIAGVSLLIGAVGIFSVLKISISERLFEIGLRKSMGATDAEVFLQFLIESVTLSTIGAALGAIAGMGIVAKIAGNFPAGLPISSGGMVIAISFAIGAGLFAGVYPSLAAARMEPVEALRA